MLSTCVLINAHRNFISDACDYTGLSRPLFSLSLSVKGAGHKTSSIDIESLWNVTCIITYGSYYRGRQEGFITCWLRMTNSQGGQLNEGKLYLSLILK